MPAWVRWPEKKQEPAWKRYFVSSFSVLCWSRKNFSFSRNVVTRTKFPPHAANVHVCVQKIRKKEPTKHIFFEFCVTAREKTTGGRVWKAQIGLFPYQIFCTSFSPSLVANCVWGEQSKVNLILLSFIFSVHYPLLKLPRQAPASSAPRFIYRKPWWVFNEKSGPHPPSEQRKIRKVGKANKPASRHEAKSEKKTLAGRSLWIPSRFSLNNTNADMQFLFPVAFVLFSSF